MTQFLKTKKEILAWLHIYDEYYEPENYTFTTNEEGDLEVNSNTSVMLHKNIEQFDFLPVKFGHVKGSFYIKTHPITSLKGCPHTVVGDFHVTSTDIQTLEFAPGLIGGDMDVSKNSLTSLKGCPAVIYDSLFADENYLTNLVGAPKKVNGDFILDNNNLTSLIGMPHYIGKNFSASSNLLVELDVDLDGIIQDSIILLENNIASFKNFPKNVLGGLAMAGNKLKNLDGCPTTINNNFILINNQIEDMSSFPSKVGGHIDLGGNPVFNMENSRAEYHSYEFWHSIHLEHLEKKNIGLEKKRLEESLGQENLSLSLGEKFKI